MKLFTSIWIIFTYCILCNLSQNSNNNNKVALSHITLLLPYTSHYKQSPTRFKITSHGGLSNGCVEWTVEPKQGVIDIIQTQTITHYHRDECPPNTFNEAIIKAVSPPKNGRTSATITATDPKTGYSAECEVFIDKVHRLQVATSTRLIYLGKYESISVNGFDDKGNKFSTLHGLSMKWSGIKEHLQIISFEEASLMLPDVMNGNGYDLNRNRNPLPVKGIRTGQENVEVAIDIKRNAAHIGCGKTTAVLFVVMQLQLVPRILYAAKCCIASFDLITTSHSELDLITGNIKLNETYIYSDDLYGELKRQKIDIPNNQYKFKLENPNIKMRIEQDGTLYTTNIIEDCKLLVEDMVADDVSTDTVLVENNADARVFVVDTHSIKAEVIKNKVLKRRPNTYTKRKDNTDWYLTQNEDYRIRLTLYDKAGNAICVRDIHHTEFHQKSDLRFLMNLKSWKQKYICKKIEFNVEIIDKNEFAFIKQSETDNQFDITPNKLGPFTLKFTAKGTNCAYPEILATSTKKVIVTSRVSFKNTSSVFCANSEINHEKLVLIPYSGTHNIHKAVVFFEGGSGRYRLEIADTNIASLLNHDIALGQDRRVSVVLGDNIGNTHLFLIDYFNPDNFVYVNVSVEWIKVWALDKNVAKEIIIDNYIEIPLMIRDRFNRRFSALDGLEEVIKSSSSQQLVRLEFIAPNIEEIINNIDKVKDISNNTQIIKNIKRATMNTLNKDYIINCGDLDGVVRVNGVNAGYDVFSITLYNKEMNITMNSSMFVSVYDFMIAEHVAVAIAININEAYTMHWDNGPNPWPIKDVLPVDDQFVHPLQVSVTSSHKDKKDFSFRYNGGTLEFICNSEFHYFVELVVQNRVWSTLPFPVQSVVSIEVFCFPQFKFNASKMEMGVGTRKSAATLYPKWLSSNISSSFFISINQVESEVVSVVNNDNLIAKRLGSSWITGQLMHPTQRVHIHPNGFNDSLEIIVLFKGFTMEMASYWIINGNDEIAHIEGLDGDHHILPFRHNFDDVFIEWHSEDANIIELLPILARPNNCQVNSDEKRNNIGSGISVKLVARSVGLVNIKAIIKLRNAPPQIKKREFELTQTVTVIPQVVTSCNSIILKPNSSLSLSPQFNPDTNVAGIGQIYSIKHELNQMDKYLYVLNKKLNVLSSAPPAENVAVTLILQSQHYQRPHKVKKYPLTQSASLIVSIVEPTGLNILKSTFIADNAVYSTTKHDDIQPFWSSNATPKTGFKYSKTENILCEKQNITLFIAIIDELARKLHVMDDIVVVSNDTTIVLPRQDIKISTEDIGGAMYSTVHLDALQSGYATITFREKDVLSTSSSHHQYVYDDPTFLRTFLTIHVLSSHQCQSSFGLVFEDESNIQSNDTIKKTKKVLSETKHTHNWQSKTPKLPPKDSNVLAAVFGVVILLIIIGCTWGSCWDLCPINNNNDNNGNETIPPAAFNPYRSLQSAVDQSNAFQSFNSSGFSNINQSQWQM